jgi:uncharacterized protein (TIGR03435 family)
MNRARLRTRLLVLFVLASAGESTRAQQERPDLPPRPSGTAMPSFEVVSVKQNKSGGARTLGIGFRPGGGFSASNATLRELVQIAYSRQPFEKRQISGGPSWIDSDRFDIVAQAADRPGTSAEAFVKSMSEMVRTLLEDRFKLVVHEESRTLPIYALTLSRSDRKGPRLTRSMIDCDAIMNEARKTGKMPPPPAPGQPLPCALGPSPGRFTGGSITMTQLAQGLSPLVNRPVVDRTGLTGGYDLVVEYAPNELGSETAAGASIFTALQEQLGLKLESTTGPVDVLVVDHAEPPTPD